MGCASSSPAANDAKRTTQWQEKHLRHQQQLRERRRNFDTIGPTNGQETSSPDRHLQRGSQDDARRETLPFVESQGVVAQPQHKSTGGTQPPADCPKPARLRASSSPAPRGPKSHDHHHHHGQQPLLKRAPQRPRHHTPAMRVTNFRRVVSPLDPAYIAAASLALDTFQASVSSEMRLSTSTGATGSARSAPSLTSNPLDAQSVEL